jgi:hypothetical protein
MDGYKVNMISLIDLVGDIYYNILIGFSMLKTTVCDNIPI